MTAINQKFALYQGDDIAPIFTVKNAEGTPINISSVLEIEWIGYRDAGLAPVIKKLKSLGQIIFVTNGADGQLQVELQAADTTALPWGWYYHSVVITDSQGEISTVTTGRFAVLERGKLA